MVRFNELRITEDSKHFIIDVSILNEAYYKNVYLDSIIIDTQDTYTKSGPSSTPVYSYPEEDGLEENLKHIRLTLDTTDIPNLGDLFFVYVRVKGTPAPETPCGMDNITTLGVVCNTYPFYLASINYLKEVTKNCAVPQNFINHILKLKALEVSVRTGNYTDAIQYYKEFFNTQSPINIGGCSCASLHT